MTWGAAARTATVAMTVKAVKVMRQSLLSNRVKVRMATMIFGSLSEVGVKVKVSMSISKMGEKVFFPGENISNPGKGIGNSIGKAEE